MALENLIPRRASFELSGKAYELKPLTLSVQIWILNNFSDEGKNNGFQNLEDRMMNLDVKAIAEVAYKLLDDKKDFPTLESFIDAFKGENTLLRILLPAINKTFVEATPEESEEELELKKSEWLSVKKALKILIGSVFLTLSAIGISTLWKHFLS